MDGKASVLFEEGGAVASILAVANMGVFFKPGGQHSTMGTMYNYYLQLMNRSTQPLVVYT